MIFGAVDFLLLIVTPLIAFCVGYYFHVQSSVKQLKKSSEEIAQAESRVEAQPEKAKPAWDLARITLEAYYKRNLSQITSIFWLSVFVMVVGFGVLTWGIFQAIASTTTIVPAVIASIAGILTEFIGATFVFIYKSTIRQASDYSMTLERINSVGMAMQILDTMPNDARAEDLKSRTKATLAELLIRHIYHEPERADESNLLNSKEIKARESSLGQG